MLDRVPFRLLAAVFLVSLSTLVLEIGFTRILSVVLSYHYVFLVISIALLGLGSGAIFVYFRQQGNNTVQPSMYAALFAVAAPLSVLGITRGPFSGNLAVTGLLLLVPFFMAGAVIALIFRRFAAEAGKLYAADLIGAATGSLLAVPLLNLLGGVNTGLFTGVTAALAALLFSLEHFKKRYWLALTSLVLVGSFLAAGVRLPVMTSVTVAGSDKELAASLAAPGGARVVASRWSSFGRTDLVEYNSTPDQMALFIDATAGTPMLRFSGDPADPGAAVEALKSDFPGYFPLAYLKDEQKDAALIIGPGGGRDVLLALLAGIRDVTAVEVNPDLVELVKSYSAFNGGIYSGFPNVNIVTAEGRNYLRTRGSSYDVIFLSLPITKTSRSPDGFALTENFLFTRESVAEYLDRLTPEGSLVVVTHGQIEVAKLVQLSISVMEQRGIDTRQAMDYIYTVGSHHNPVFVLSKSRLQPEQSYALHQAVHSSANEPASSYFPYVAASKDSQHLERGVFKECSMLDPILMALSTGVIRGSELAGLVFKAGYDITPATDDRPFFFKFEPGLPGPVAGAFWLALLALLALWFLPYLSLSDAAGKRAVKSRGKLPFTGVIYFTLLGAGFMLVEVPLIQRLTLYVGEPTLAISVLLFSVLLGAGLGGMVSNRLGIDRLRRWLPFVVIAIALAISVYAFGMPFMLARLLDTSLGLRVVLAGASLGLLGGLLGLPFPAGLRLVKESGSDRSIPWLWGVNGVASVLGSVLAIMLALSLGFTAALALAAVLYAITIFTLRAFMPFTGRA